MARRNHDFQTIHSEGGLLPPDLLRRILDPKEKVPGTLPEDYGLPQGERINETITQSWNRLRRHWAEFREAARSLPQGEPGTGLTNDKWSVPLLRELGFGMLPTSPGPEINGRTYAINRFFGPTAIHLVGCGLSLDRRAAGVRGAAAANPHGLVQEFLNRSEGHLWAIVSNGLRFRVLRDNQALSRQSYLEFDLESMFSGEVFSDFVLLWLIAHATRFAPREERKSETCWLEQWTKLANEQGARALESLRGGVERALQVLGQGFVGHPRNTALRESLRSGQISLSDFHGQLLRVVYRLIFLFVAEDRTLDGVSLLHPRDESEEGRQRRERYAAHYSTARLRELAARIKGSRHGDLWQQFNLLVGMLSGEERFASACEPLALPALGSFLWSPASTAILNASSLTGGDGTELANADFLEALRHLAFTRQDKVLRPVDYKNLGSEEFGGVYESFLALTPQISGDGARFTFAEFAGNERKTSGSYYTPDCLVQCLLDSALDPVVDEAIKGKTGQEAEKAILGLKVCDTAVGSGHFLVGAAHRLARHLARVRAHAMGESEPSPTLYQHALRDVIGRCLYGVDINPMAVELCKVTLWLEALEPGKPLSFLDHHIRCGNSLLGATPALIEQGIPDEAFTPIEGDDKEYCRKYKKRNREERTQMELDEWAPWEHLGNLPEAMARLDALQDDTIEGILEKQRHYEEIVRSSGYVHSRFLADAWCAAFVWKKREDSDLPHPITNKILRQIERNPQSMYDFTPWLRDEIMRLARQYQFFHWHLAFPEVFPPRGVVHACTSHSLSSGFSVILGNPPWERVKLQEKEWFAERNPEIANASNAAARKRLISALEEVDPALLRAWEEASRQAEGESHLVRNTGRYPLCGRGDINTYSIFAELNRSLLNPTGHVGCIVPSGIATDDTTKFFFQDLVNTASLVSLYSFENEEFVFPAIHHATKFCLLTMAAPGSESQREIDFVFFARQVHDLPEKERHFALTANDIALLNPNTRTCPIFRCKQDAELTKHIYRRIPVLIRDASEKQPEENPWGISFLRMIDMANDSGLFRTREQLEAEGFVLKGNVFTRDGDVYRPLYEGKMFWHFDHRFGTYEGQTEAQANQGKLPELTTEQHRNPHFLSLPRYWVAEENVRARVPRRPELLASALGLPERWRKEAVIKALSYWAAGYHRKVGNEERAKRLLACVLQPTLADKQIDVLKHWLLDPECERMQERFPLTLSDVLRLISPSDDPIPLAEELLDRFSPGWFVAFRDVTSAVVLRTTVFSLIPFVGVGHTAPLVFFGDNKARNIAAFLGCVNSLALDYCARQSVGGSHLTYSYLRQFPVPAPLALEERASWDTNLSVQEWCFPRISELVLTSWDHQRFSYDASHILPPFCWDEARRFQIRSELDAAFFHLYLGSEQHWIQNGSKKLLTYFPTPRRAVEYVMDTFRILRERDEAAHGSYRTKETILRIYDSMQRAIATGQPYETLLDPAPGPPCDADGSFTSMYQFDRDNWPVHIHPAHPDWEESLLEAWFGVCQKRWSRVDDAQVFPWDGREAFIHALIPYLAQEKPGEKFEFYRDAALLASRSGRCEALLLDDTLRTEYRQAIAGFDWLQFPDTHRIRPRAIRETLQSKHIIQTDAKTGTTTLVDAHRLPPLPPELKSLLPLFLKAADNLDRLQRRALETAEAAKVSFTHDDITKEFAALSIA